MKNWQIFDKSRWTGQGPLLYYLQKTYDWKIFSCGIL